MSKLRKALQKTVTSIQKFGPNKLNKAGSLSYQLDPDMALYQQVATSLWSGDGYYEKQQEWFERFQSNVSDVMQGDVRFPFALAAYARDKKGLGLRTSSLALFVEAATNPNAKGTGLIRKYTPKVLLRADEPAKVIAYFKKHHSGTIPHGMLRGIADTLPGFDEYQLAKYKKSGPVSMRDAFRLARPKPTGDTQQSLWAQVVSDELQPPYTWEVELSRCTTADEKRQVWNTLISSGKLGFFALVRDLRNIIKYQADIEQALSQITEKDVLNSGILPFQWYKAYNAVFEEGGAYIAEPLQNALQYSLNIVPKLKGITLVACDNSGSMSSIRRSRGLSNAEIGNLMGAMALYCSEDGIVGTFGDTFEFADTDLSKGLFYNKKMIDECGRRTGHSTNAWRVIQNLTQNRIYIDRLILLSDMQCYDSEARYNLNYMGHSLSSELEMYQKINPDVTVYSINLASQDNTSQFAPDQPVVLLAGWSESIFQYISAIEEGQDILSKIREIY